MNDLMAAATIERDSFRLDVDLTVKPGETLGIMGDIGTGKSSVLWLLAGRLHASSGTVTGTRPEDTTLLTQLFQADLAEDRTGVENVSDAILAVAEHRSIQPSDPHGAARSILAELGVADHVVDRLPWTFSGAEAQRVALARALAPRPGLVLLDEPTGALDKRGRADVANYLGQWLGNYEGRTVVASTSRQLLDDLCDRVHELPN